MHSNRRIIDLYLYLDNLNSGVLRESKHRKAATRYVNEKISSDHRRLEYRWNYIFRRKEVFL